MSLHPWTAMLVPAQPRKVLVVDEARRKPRLPNSAWLSLMGAASLDLSSDVGELRRTIHISKGWLDERCKKSPHQKGGPEIVSCFRDVPKSEEVLSRFSILSVLHAYASQTAGRRRNLDEHTNGWALQQRLGPGVPAGAPTMTICWYYYYCWIFYRLYFIYFPCPLCSALLPCHA